MLYVGELCTTTNHTQSNTTSNHVHPKCIAGICGSCSEICITPSFPTPPSSHCLSPHYSLFSFISSLPPLPPFPSSLPTLLSSSIPLYFSPSSHPPSSHICFHLSSLKVEKYMQSLPPECVPAVGAEGESYRRTQCFTQLPLYDFSLEACHKMSDLEKKRMGKFTERRRTKFFGVGKLKLKNTRDDQVRVSVGAERR